SIVSWWPIHNTWLDSGLNVGFWSQEAEDWFQKRLKDIVEGTATPVSNHEWKS
ncbi:hypothetical protein BC835DRAFT_1236207, partial [Cytidiella melzeri]